VVLLRAIFAKAVTQEAPRRRPGMLPPPPSASVDPPRKRRGHEEIVFERRPWQTKTFSLRNLPDPTKRHMGRLRRGDRGDSRGPAQQEVAFRGAGGFFASAAELGENPEVSSPLQEKKRERPHAPPSETSEGGDLRQKRSPTLRAPEKRDRSFRVFQREEDASPKVGRTSRNRRGGLDRATVKAVPGVVSRLIRKNPGPRAPAIGRISQKAIFRKTIAGTGKPPPVTKSEGIGLSYRYFSSV